MNAWFSQMFSSLHGEQQSQKNSWEPGMLTCGLRAEGPSPGSHIRKTEQGLLGWGFHSKAMSKPGEFLAFAPYRTELGTPRLSAIPMPGNSWLSPGRLQLAWHLYLLRVGVCEGSAQPHSLSAYSNEEGWEGLWQLTQSPAR